MQDGVARTVCSFSNLANGSSFDGRRELSEPSKARKFLGTGLGDNCIFSFSQKIANHLDYMQLKH